MSTVFLHIAVAAVLLQGAVSLFNPPPSNCTLDPAASGATVCGVAANTPTPTHPPLPEKKYRDPQAVQKLDNCVYLCRQLGYCTGFSYDSKTGLCQLYYAVVDRITPNRTSDTVFYQMKCFQCPDLCPIPLGKNLLVNGDFEASSKYAGPWFAGPPAKIVSPGYKSKFALNYKTSPAHSNEKFVGNSIYPYTCHSGITFTAQFDLKLIPASPQSACGASVTFGQVTTYTYYAKGIGTHGWTTVGGLNAKAPGVIEFYLGLYNGDAQPYCDYFIDNVSIVARQGTPTTKPGTPELLSNPGFETGSLAPWTVPFIHGATATVTSPGLTGSYAFLYNYTNAELSGVVLRQKIHTTPGVEYLVSLEYLNPDVFFFARLLFQKSGHLQDAYETVFNMPVTATPQSADYMFVALGNTTLITLSLDHTGSGDKPGTITLDNFSVKEAALKETA